MYARSLSMGHSYTQLLYHIVFSTKLRQDRALSDIVRGLKANSSGWIHDNFPDQRTFAWQQGYGAFTVSLSQVDKVRRYIANQEAHHRKHSFQEEFVALLKRHGIDFDEKFLWQ